MSHDPTTTALPEGTVIYREYEAQLLGGQTASIFITLGNLQASSQSATRAREDGALVYGQVLLERGCAPMEWSYDGTAITIVTGPPPALLQAELKEAIGAFVLHFLRALEAEIDALSGEALH
jgi:hypothetical protein